MRLTQLHTEDTNLFLGYAESRIGGRMENQDAYGVIQTKFGWLFTVCDGMGGGPGGRTASSIAVTEIIKGIEEAQQDEEISNIIIKAIRRSNMAIIERGNADPSLKGMGSTATVLLITDKAAYVAHIGDSRIYQIRGKHKVFRTFDHSVVFEMVRKKVITEEQARLSAQSNIITRALGIAPDLEVDPIIELPYEKGDRFLLCSDGIHGTMPEKELLSMASDRKHSLGAVTDDIATFVDESGHSNGGGHDNLTIMLIETLKPSKKRPKMTKKSKILILTMCIFLIVSVIGNIVQFQSIGRKSSIAMVDSIKVWTQRDSVKKDSIHKLQNEIDSFKTKIAKVEQIIKKQ